MMRIKISPPFEEPIHHGLIRTISITKGDRQIMFENPYLVKYADKQVLMFYLAKKRRRMACLG